MADGQSTLQSVQELRDEVRREHELNVAAHASHRETDDHVANLKLESHLKLAGFRPEIGTLSGEQMYASIREQIHKFLGCVCPGLDFKVTVFN
jgi:hypothetical protein